MSLTGSSRTLLNRTYTKTVGLGTATMTYNINEGQTWTDGDAVGGSQILYSANDLAIDGSGGSATSLDLVATLLDPLSGTAQTYTKIKELWIKNNTTTAGATLKVNGNFITTVILGGTTPYLIIGAGGKAHFECPSLAGYAVTSSTGDVITLQGATTTAVNIDLLIVGVGTVA